uniref:H15 domain-containing protein n=1 Tax=Oryza barthii TaxID=65489 RepID=A0A0D3H0G6_9ORYZ
MAAADEASKPPPLPPYPEMILAAIEGLNEKSGSNKSAISKFIEGNCVPLLHLRIGVFVFVFFLLSHFCELVWPLMVATDVLVGGGGGSWYLCASWTANRRHGGQIIPEQEPQSKMEFPDLDGLGGGGGGASGSGCRHLARVRVCVGGGDGVCIAPGTSVAVVEVATVSALPSALRHPSSPFAVPELAVALFPSVAPVLAVAPAGVGMCAVIGMWRLSPPELQSLAVVLSLAISGLKARQKSIGSLSKAPLLLVGRSTFWPSLLIPSSRSRTWFVIRVELGPPVQFRLSGLLEFLRFNDESHGDALLSPVMLTPKIYGSTTNLDLVPFPWRQPKGINGLSSGVHFN